ncbi:MAG: hypothetical protein COB07_05235 [Sulfurovum sp.]|nr:MAG: hypothetical protein COB07_05235 [Sulfurovum sp.]
MRFFSRLFLPFLLLAYIGTETYLKLQDSSLCAEVGCKLAGELLNFDALYLNYLGIVGVFILMILGFLSLKSKVFENLFFIGLYGAIAFEATILGYQFVANPEPCIFCLGIFSLLLLIALFSQWQRFAITLATVVAIFVGLNTLAVTKNKTFMTKSGNYLIQSESCSHCKKVKAYFAEKNIAYIPISTKEASARSFLKFAGVSSIPVLIVNEKLQHTLIVGDKKIIAHFKNTMQDESPQPKKSQTKTDISSNTMELSSDFLSAGGDNDGCALSIIEAPSCDDDNTSH